MATKKELIGFLEEVLKTEEKAIPLYTRHIGSTLFLSRFDETQRTRIQTILETLKEESQKHAEIFGRLVDKIKREPRDVY